MNRAVTWIAVALFATQLAACGRSAPESGSEVGDSAFGTVISIGSLGISRDAVTIRPEGRPDARILPGGRLTIDGRDIAVNAAQRAQLVAYHDAAMQLREHGKQTGIAGAKVGLAAIGAVISGLAAGDPKSIGPKVTAEAERVKQAALKLCEDLARMRQAQDALAVELEAFRPYATIGAGDLSDCRDTVGADPEVPPAEEEAIQI